MGGTSGWHQGQRSLEHSRCSSGEVRAVQFVEWLAPAERRGGRPGRRGDSKLNNAKVADFS